MDDYAKARYKTTGKVTLLKFMVNGGMNPEMSNVDFVQDGDLNKSLKHYVSYQINRIFKLILINNLVILVPRSIR